ncbi:pyruvate:ferredoxin (flavodoxin) oxidoreductase [Thermoactinomyces mirandus]|uniref:Pyruvate:ferredoxin (Flavodoxin) oxidoreductase n=1 Tax=Thermoactinomyces mirandus TaxID=2756294 RepID=A0A7W2ARP7_9BACL|nr:pyruvate:ferredoxin (flavodoxin) oxidoreductase [Thermoactinomyces mirandus]MBA4601626.1 pyruvate:ferredoxin (flavodoxin) oxidoreductase [Thermoactinomyces mirandus]
MQKNMKTMDGTKAAAYASYAFTDCACIYPITPSSPMAEYVDEWAAQGKKNIYGQIVKVVEMQSEAGAASALHGTLASGALGTTYTASQGLMLMIPNLYKIAGELMPGVIHVAARALSTHALSIFGDHSDVMSCRMTGFAMLASSNVQEVMDLGAIAHLASIKSRVPFMHFFDGFRTSHEQQKIEVLDYEDLAELVDWEAVKSFRSRGLNPEHPIIRGTAQNPDIYFQAREANNVYYEAVPDIVYEYMQYISRLTGREYLPFNYYGAEDAEDIIVSIGSSCDTIEETVDYLTARGEKVGVIKVHLYRPFSNKYFFKVLPGTVKRIAVLDRTKEPGSLGEPLLEDVKTLFHDVEERPLIIGGRYGLGSKELLPSDIIAVFDNLRSARPKKRFTVGITDDVTHLSLPRAEHIETTPEGTIQCKFYGMGSDGTVGANKQSVKIIGDTTDLYVQAYFSYDSKKSGGYTVSHLRFGKKPIKSPYLITGADFVSCSNQSYINTLDMLTGLKKGGTFLLNCVWKPEKLDKKLPASVKRYIAENDINFYIINAVDIARDIGLGNRTNMIMQSAFFKLVNVIPLEDAVKELKRTIKETYGHKGDRVVNLNYTAVDKGIESLIRIDVPADWAKAVDEPVSDKQAPEFIRSVLQVMNRLEGDKLPVSTFKGREDGSFPVGTSRYEKRGVAGFVPEWILENCIQCNQCSVVCSHAAIRPFLLNEEEVKNAPASFETRPAVGKELAGLHYRIQVSPYDCMGCGVCVETCPSREKALVMKPIDTQRAQSENWDYAMTVSVKDNRHNRFSVKGSQFAQPLLEFSGACGGCPETSYAKLVTQLFGERMIVANATGCSSIWGASAPSMPYCTNNEGKGPAWTSGLFEDNAEYGYGIYLGIQQQRERIAELMKEALSMDVSPVLKEAFQQWLDGRDDAKASKAATDKMLPLLEGQDNPVLRQIYGMKDHLIKKSVWIFGGDGWAYDIGYGGLDHVLASNADVNVLVFDTEVYSNTGGQASKSTPAAAIAKFASSGKRTRKKDLGAMAMTYGYVYVAQIGMGANMNQALKAIREAEAYKGPSLIIAYSPCINHGLKGGMSRAQAEISDAVKVGYWSLYRYNPDLKKEGKNPFKMDSREPDFTAFKDFLMGEVRYASLAKQYPEQAEELFEKTMQDAKERYEFYKRLSQG